MKSVQYYKMQGAGNTFLIFIGNIDDFNDKLMDFRELYPECDQLLVLDPNTFFFHIFNADGSEAQQCLNGSRCIAYLIYFLGWVSETEFEIENKSTRMSVIVSPDEEWVRLNLDISIKEDENVVDVGNLHFLTLVDNFTNFDLEESVKKIKKECQLDVNFSFIKVQSQHQIMLKVFERGVGETQACGSAALACAYFVVKHCGLKWPVKVNFKTDSLEISKNSKTFTLSGPVKMVFQGELHL